MGSFSTWHWLVVVILGGIAYALYRLVKPKQIKAGYSAVRATYVNSENLRDARKLTQMEEIKLTLEKILPVWLAFVVKPKQIKAGYSAVRATYVNSEYMSSEYMNSENLKSARKLFFIALGIDMGVLALNAIGDLWVIGVFEEVQAGEREFTGSFISTLGVWEKFGWLPFVTLIGVGLALVMWLQSCYRYAKESIGATKFQHEGWIGIGWIFPVFNLFKPYQIISEIYKAGAAGYQSDDDWKKESGSRLLLTWWVFWVVTHLIMWIVGKDMMRNSFRDDLTLPQVVNLLDTQVGFYVVSLIVSGLWFVVANHLTERLLIRPPLQTVKNIEVGASSISSPASSPLFASAQILADLNNHSQARSAIADPPPSWITIPAGVGPETPEISADEEAIYTAIADEMENGKVRKGLWTKLWTEAEGDEHKVKLAYIKARVKEITAERQETSQEVAKVLQPGEKTAKRAFTDPQWSEHSTPTAGDSVAPLLYPNTQDVTREVGIFEEIIRNPRQHLPFLVVIAALLAFAMYSYVF